VEVYVGVEHQDHVYIMMMSMKILDPELPNFLTYNVRRNQNVYRVDSTHKQESHEYR
jgi:hypothetical protein